MQRRITCKTFEKKPASKMFRHTVPFPTFPGAGRCHGNLLVCYSDVYNIVQFALVKCIGWEACMC